MLLPCCLLAQIALVAGSCVTSSSPNPIRQTYPNSPTGTLNGTLTVIQLDYDVARSIVPAQYPILKSSYLSMLPGFPADKYPLILQVALDHDVGTGSTFSVPDFRRASLSFPFVDLLNDGYSTFKYGPSLVLSDSVIAIAGAAAYGPPLPFVANFEPSCNAYEAVNGDPNTIKSTSTTLLIGSNLVSTTFTTAQSQPYPTDFLKNVTNQPIFTASIGLLCDNFITIWNTSLTTGANAPVPIKGTAIINGQAVVNGPPDGTYAASGVKADFAFLENNLVPCATLKGYHYQE